MQVVHDQGDIREKAEPSSLPKTCVVKASGQVDCPAYLEGSQSCEDGAFGGPHHGLNDFPLEDPIGDPPVGDFKKFGEVGGIVELEEIENLHFFKEERSGND